MKVFLSSTARDLGPYREAVHRAILGLDGCECVRMEDFGARDWAADDFCRARVAECQVFVGLVGLLYGSQPAGKTASYTVREYEAAVDAGLRRLLFVSSDDFPLPGTLREPDKSWRLQQRFRERLKKDRIVASFASDPEALATQIVTALRNLEREQNAQSGTCTSRGSRRALTSDLAQVRERYLTHIVERYRYLDFKGFGVSDRVPIRLPLVEMYVPLKVRLETPQGETWDRQRLAGRKPSKEEAETLDRTVSRPVLELLNDHDGLVLLGDPGSGKTTFLKYVALALANSQGDMMDLGDRLPVLLPLSAYANALAKEDVPLRRFLPLYHQEHRGFDVSLDHLLESALPHGGILFLLDGLDEVKDLSLRNTVVERVQDFYGFHRKQGNKFVLTSRIVGYREIRPVAEGLAEGTLVDFDDKEIRAFVGRWTLALERAAAGDTQMVFLDAQREQNDLLAAIERNPGVRSLAANPLLLTILALMKRQGVTLPERRTELYQTYVETLLRNWNLVRSLAGRSARDLDVVETVRILAPLALWMHRVSPGVGLVREWELHQELERIYRERGHEDPDRATRNFLQDVRDHAALLLERGGHQYGFIHLTFQEYLAAVAMAQKGQQGIEPVVEALAEHVDEAPWHEVVLLTIGYLGIVQKLEEAASAVIEALLDHAPGTPGQAVVLAGRALADAGSAGVTPACRHRTVGALLRTMRTDEVEPIRRADAGVALADIGDPRPEVMTLDGMEFCWVPAGPFWMGHKGSDKQPVLHEVPYDYLIARYPVTVAQFRAYIEMSGRQLGYPEGLRGALNAPMVWVNWNEAVGFCEWLTEKWRMSGLLRQGWVVLLPTESEWVKAGRGGVWIPKRPRATSLLAQNSVGFMVENRAPYRLYPWDKNIDSTEIMETEKVAARPVGCFPKGASPYGCEEMMTNVSEWTHSLAALGEMNPRRHAPTGSSRILRGGLAPEYRDSTHPAHRSQEIGFRVLIAESTLVFEPAPPPAVHPPPPTERVFPPIPRRRQSNDNPAACASSRAGQFLPL